MDAAAMLPSPAVAWSALYIQLEQLSMDAQGAYSDHAQEV